MRLFRWILPLAIPLIAACSSSSPGTRAASAQPRAAPVADSEGVYDISVVEVKPQIINGQSSAKMLEQSYPAGLREAGVSGTVVLSFVVEPDGRTSNVRVTSTDHVGFVAPASTVALAMRFRPGQVGGKPVRVRAVVPISFHTTR